MGSICYMNEGQFDSEDPSNPNANILSFSSVTIHNIGTKLIKGSRERLSGTFKRAESYPAPLHAKYTKSVKTPVDTWSPLPCPTEGHLELLQGAKIGEGGSSTAYVASAQDSTAPGVPNRICVKWARAQSCRSLAREAWFYEQLYREGSCEGVATPRCYGFFTMNFLETRSNSEGDYETNIRAWEELGSSDKEPDLPDDDELNADYFRDDASLKCFSPWNSWKHRKGDYSLFAVLLIEDLGQYYVPTVVDEVALSDIKEIVVDLGHTGIRHYDVRWPNVLRSLTTDESAYCPRHKKIHKWRLIDFDRSTKTVFHLRADRRACISQSNEVENEYFFSMNPPCHPYDYKEI